MAVLAADGSCVPLWPYLCLALAQLVATSPVYLRNARHGFASFRFQTAERAAASGGPTLHWLVLLVVAQLVLVGPPLCYAIGREIVRAIRGLNAKPSEERERTLFLLAFVLPLLSLCLVGSLLHPGQTQLAHALLCGGGVFGRTAGQSHPRLRVGRDPVLLHALAATELLLYPVPIRSDDTFYGWGDLAADLEAREQDGLGAFVFPPTVTRPARSSPSTPGRKIYGPAPSLGLLGQQFDYLGDDLNVLVGHDALFIDSAPSDLTPARAEDSPARLRDHFRRVTQLDPILISSGERIVRKFYIYKCLGHVGER